MTWFRDSLSRFTKKVFPPFTAICFVGWTSAEDKPSEPKKNQIETKERTAVEAERPMGLSSAQVAAWLILQHHREVEISKWAAEHANSEQVKTFAQEMAAQHGEMIAKLHAAGLVEKKSAEAELGEVLQQLAHRVDQRLSDPDSRIELGFRGDDQRESAADRRDARERLGKEREQVRETRQEVRESRRDDQEKNGETTEKPRRGDVRDERRDLRDERADARDNRRDLTADVVGPP